KNTNATVATAVTAQPSGRGETRRRTRSTNTKAAASATTSDMTTSVRSTHSTAPAAPPYSSISCPLATPATTNTLAARRAMRDMLRLSQLLPPPGIRRPRLSDGGRPHHARVLVFAAQRLGDQDRGAEHERDGEDRADDPGIRTAVDAGAVHRCVALPAGDQPAVDRDGDHERHRQRE